MPNYGETEYWDKRYRDQMGHVYDWLESFERLREVIEKTCTFESKILMLGCGNSTLSEELYEKGYENIYNIDISPIVIKQMSERNEHMVNMKYMVMDVRNLEFDDLSFDVVIDKSTIDSLLCSDESFLNVGKMTHEISRILGPKGFYLCITYGAPDFRLEHLNRDHLSFSVETIRFDPKDPKDGYHYAYICQKQPDADQKRIANWPEVMKSLQIDEEKEKLLALSQKVYRDNEREIKLPEDDLQDEEHDKIFHIEDEIKDEDFMSNFMKDEDVENMIANLAKDFQAIREEEDRDSDDEEPLEKVGSIETDPTKALNANLSNPMDPKAQNLVSQVQPNGSMQGSIIQANSLAQGSQMGSVMQSGTLKNEKSGSMNLSNSQLKSDGNLSEKSMTEINDSQGSNTRKTSEATSKNTQSPNVKSMESSVIMRGDKNPSGGKGTKK